MNRHALRDPRPGRPSAEEIKKTTQRIDKMPSTSSAQRKASKPAADDLNVAEPQGPKDMG
jgi:hypothetical protein